METFGGGRRLAHVPALDGVRGLAIAGVLLFHAGHLDGGYLGVDLFFVLSGFLITSLLLAESRASGGVALRRFWSRRARRLLPALGGLLVGVAIWAVLFARPSELAQVRGDALATIGYVANWRFVFERQDYFALFRSPSPLQHTWSLAIEEQFYLVWPLVVFGLVVWWRRAGPKAVLVTSLVLAALSTAEMALLYAPDRISRVYYGTDTRAAAILLGAALAAALATWGHVAGRGARLALEVAAIAGIGVLAWAWSALDGSSSTLYRGGFALCALCAVAVLASAVHPERLVVARVLSFRPLCLLGIVSYGVYLWHWPVFIVLDRQRTGLDGWDLFGLQVAVTLAIAAASFVLLEQPIRRGALTARRWRLLTPTFGCALLLLLVVVTNGSQPAVATAARTERRWSVPSTTAPVPVPAGAAATTTTTVPPPTRVLVVGDSVAVSLTPGIQHAATAAKIDPVLGAAVGCDQNGRHAVLPGTRASSAPCPPGWRELVTQLHPQVVLMVDSGVWTIRDDQVGGRTLRFGTSQWDAYRVEQWQQTVDVMVANGGQAVMLGAAYLRPPLTSPPRASAASPGAIDRLDADMATLAARNPGHVRVIDLRTYVCPNGHFQEGLDGVPELRPDGVHYGPAGSDLVGRWLAPQLAVTG